jgi:hypothetical protein
MIKESTSNLITTAMKPHISTTKPLNPIEIAVIQERLRQARYSFNIALISSTAFAVISLLGTAIVLLKVEAAGAVVASTGMAGCVGCMRLAKDANDRLDKIIDEV